MWNFKGTLWNSTQNILPIHWKIWLLYNIEILRALRFKSSYAFLKRPPGDRPLRKADFWEGFHCISSALVVHQYVIEHTCIHVLGIIPRTKFLQKFNFTWSMQKIAIYIIASNEIFMPMYQLTLKWLGHFFSKCDFIFWCCSPYVQYFFLYETGPIQWMFSQHCGYWWPGALAPGHQ